MALGREEISARYKKLQNSICEAIETEDSGACFKSENWQRVGGGGGRTNVIENGNVIEKGGVNFSAVFGQLPEKIAKALGTEVQEFYATGVSIVMHPINPFVPIIHMNVRYFEMERGQWWFGGGVDLTPHYVNEAEAVWFHSQLKSICDKHHTDFYERFRAWADSYFYIKHRKESRGVSGVFFDRLNTDSESLTKQQLFDFQLDIAESFAPIYCKLMHDNASQEFNKTNKAWQFHRRSRYVEFNLVQDKGTKFGLDTDGRIDSILMSLPPSTGWHYTQNWPKHGEEAKTAQILKTKYIPS